MEQSKEEKYYSDILSIIIDKPNLFEVEKLSNIKKIISDDEKYNLDFKLFHRIADDKAVQERLASSKFVKSIIERYVKSKKTVKETIQLYNMGIDSFNKYDEKYTIDQSVLNSLLSFLRESIVLCFDYFNPNEDNEIVVEKDVSNLVNDEFVKTFREKIFTLFEYVITNINVSKEINQDSFNLLYMSIKDMFEREKYVDSLIYFKFLETYLWRQYTEAEENKIAELEVTFAQFIRTRPPKMIYDAINTIREQSEFINTKVFLDELVLRTKNDSGFIKYFYDKFDDDTKNDIIEYHLGNQNSPVDKFVKVLEEIKFNPPDKIDLATKIISELNRLNNAAIDDQVKLIDCLFKLKVNDFDYTSFKHHISTLITNNNYQVHEFACNQLQLHKNLYDNSEKKQLGETAFTSFLGNTAAFFRHVPNIFKLKLGVTNAFLSDLTTKQPYLNQLLAEFINRRSNTFLDEFLSHMQGDEGDNFIALLINRIHPDVNQVVQFYPILEIIKKHLNSKIITNTRNGLVIIIKALLLEANNASDKKLQQLGLEYYILMQKLTFPEEAIENSLWNLQASTTEEKLKKSIQSYFNFNGDNIIIKEAIYGTNEHEIDVTDILTNRIKGNSLHVHATNNAFTDPHVGIEKSLKIKYKIGKQKQVIKTYKEGSWLILP